MKTLTYHSPWGDISEGLYLTDINILSLAQLDEGPWGIATAQVPGLLTGESFYTLLSVRLLARATI